MNSIAVNKNRCNLTVLEYTGLFGLDYNVVDNGDDWVIEYDANATEICNAIEEHVGYMFNYPDEVQVELLNNASKDMTAKLNKYIDGIARSYRYDDMKSVRSYCGFPNPFRDQCLVLAAWSAECWVVAGQIEAAVKSGERPMPSMEEVIAELPECELA
jgi:hypothetical protein